MKVNCNADTENCYCRVIKASSGGHWEGAQRHHHELQAASLGLPSQVFTCVPDQFRASHEEVDDTCIEDPAVAADNPVEYAPLYALEEW